jgi:hypothetical protein
LPAAQAFAAGFLPDDQLITFLSLTELAEAQSFSLLTLRPKPCALFTFQLPCFSLSAFSFQLSPLSFLCISPWPIYLNHFSATSAMNFFL